MTDVHQAFRSWNLHCRLNREALDAEKEGDEAALAARTRRSHAVKPSLLALGLGASLGRSGAKAGSRSPTAARRGLAAGSQAAVVKLASYAAGGVRLGALLKYQSREGDLPLERDDGSFIQGMSEVRELAAEWDVDGDRREPSKDVLYFVVTLSERPAGDDLDRAIGQALVGHKFAWRIQEQTDSTEIHVVVSAASAVRSAQGRAERLFANRKSLGALQAKLETAFQSDIGFEERGWGHGVDGAARLLCRLTRDGEAMASSSSGDPIDSHEANWVVANSWKRALRSREQRDAAAYHPQRQTGDRSGSLPRRGESDASPRILGARFRFRPAHGPETSACPCRRQDDERAWRTHRPEDPGLASLARDDGRGGSPDIIFRWRPRAASRRPILRLTSCGTFA